MSMLSFSVFQFHNCSDLNEFQRKLRSHRSASKSVNGWDEGEALNASIQDIEDFNSGDHETVQIEGNAVQYLFLEGHIERPRYRKEWRLPNGDMKAKEDRINRDHASLLIFQSGEKIYGIVFAGIYRAKAILKDCFPEATWGSVLPVNHQVTEDLFYWIFKRFIDTPDESLSSTSRVHLTALESYMGKTRDNAHAMRGEGSRISTILGTLAFLFNNEELKAIRPAIQYGNEKVLIEIGLTGTFKMWPISYRGNSFRALTGQRKENALAIFIVLKVIPALIECYEKHMENDEWSPQLKIDFIKRLGAMITSKVTSVLAEVEKKNADEDDEEIVSDDEDFDLEIGDEDDELFDEDFDEE